MAMKMTKYNKYMTFHDPSPVPTWLFTVKFYANTPNPFDNWDLLNQLYCVSCSLPESETITTDVYFFGSMKTVPIKRKYDGEVSMTFLDKQGVLEHLFRMTNKVHPSDKDLKEYSDLADPFNFRDEFSNKYKFDKVQIDVYDITITKIYRTFYLYNPIITKVNYASELDVGGEDSLKYNITVHYDYWEFDDPKDDEEIKEEKK